MNSENDPYLRYITDFFRRWAPLYDAFAWFIQPVYNRVAALIEPGSTVLDVCTGTGQIAVRAARRGCNVTGVDISAEMLERARAKAEELGEQQAPQISFLQLDVRELPFGDREFDTVVLSLCLHDMPRKVRFEVLREAFRVARKEVILADYEFPKNALVHRCYTGAIDLFESPYFRSFVEEGIPAQLEAAASVGLTLETVRSERILLGMFSVYVLRRAHQLR